MPRKVEANGGRARQSFDRSSFSPFKEYIWHRALVRASLIWKWGTKVGVVVGRGTGRGGSPLA
jgi:hypothetical protein